MGKVPAPIDLTHVPPKVKLRKLPLGGNFLIRGSVERV